MNFLNLLLSLIVVINGYFLVMFVMDLVKNKEEIIKEPGDTRFLPFTSAILFFLSTFGVSDFAISTVIYPKLKWVSMKKLPGTLNTQCVIPVAAMALLYISSIQVGITTLVVCIVAQVIGAYIGPRFVVKLPEKTIKFVIGVGLLIASVLLLAAQLQLIPQTGVATSLTGAKLVIAAICLFIFGALNNIGIGSYAPTFVTVMLLGLSPAVAFPIMMGAATFSIPVGSAQFVKFGEYSRKITLFTTIFGTLGVLCAVYLVKSLNTYALKWIVVFVLIYTAYTMLAPNKKQ